MKKLLFFSLSLFPLLSFAQFFETQIDPGLPIVFRSLNKTNDGGSVLLGDAQSMYWAAKIDSTGNVEWAKKFAGLFLNGCSLGSNKFLTYAFESTWQYVMLNSYDKDGNPLTAFALPESLEVKCIHPTADGGTIATAHFIPAELPIIIKTDSSGSVEWTKSIDSVWVFTGDHRWIINEVIQTYDSGYFLAGTFTPVDTFNAPVYGMFIKLDQNGDTIWTRTYSGGTYWGSVMMETYTKDILISTASSFLLVDSLGSILWEKNFPDSLPHFYIQGCDLTSDSGYILSGYMGPQLGLLKTDRNGNPLWYHIYSNKYSNYSGVFTGNNNDFVLAGNINGNLKDIVVIKTDNNGFSTCDSTAITPVSLPRNVINYPDHPPVHVVDFQLTLQNYSLFNAYDSAFSQYDYCQVVNISHPKKQHLYLSFSPNPSSSSIELSCQFCYDGRFVQIEITDIFGKTISAKQDVLENKKVIDISNFPPGIYLVKVSNEDFCEVKKVIKQ